MFLCIERMRLAYECKKKGRGKIYPEKRKKIERKRRKKVKERNERKARTICPGERGEMDREPYTGGGGLIPAGPSTIKSCMIYLQPLFNCDGGR